MPPGAPNPGALAGIRVLDLSRILAGPWATQTLADLGAEVIKVERPGAGDDTRAWGPPFIADPRTGDPLASAYFAGTNRNKRSLAVDMTRPEGQDLLRQLAATSDVVVENFRVGGLKKYGLDYDNLKAVNPGLVYCSITGFGQDGPYAARAGYDAMIQAMGGLMGITGQPDGTPGGGPVKVGVAVADVFTGLYAAIGILAALRHREKTGEGQYLDLALLDVQVAVLANQTLNYLAAGLVPGRLGSAHPNIVPYQTVPTADGHLMLAVGNDAQFARFAEAAGQPHWATDPRFATNADRVANRDALMPLIAAETAKRPTDAWIDDLEARVVPCSPINTIDRVFADPQVVHRGLARTNVHPSGAEIPTVASPLRLSATPPRHDGPPPAVGEQTDEILRDLLDLSDDAIGDLRDAGVV